MQHALALHDPISPALCARRILLIAACTLIGAVRVIAAQNGPVESVAAAEASNAPAAHHVPANSNVISYWYGATYHTPFVFKTGTMQPADIVRNTVEFTHADFWNLGSNFANVAVHQSSMEEPAANGGAGATEIYAILRSTVGLNQISGSRRFAFGPVRNIAAEAGANFETKNSAYSPAERTLYIGPNIQFAVPRGYLNLGLHYRKEWNHEAVLGKAENYSPDFNIEPTWLLPFSLGKLRLAYTGLAEYNTPKGKDSFGIESVSEFLLRNYVSVDLGAVLFRRAQLVELNSGFWYWKNEYGKPASDPGSHQMTPIFGVSFHLGGGRAIARK
ncbi:MAG TPA: hypothetical protein VG844_15265 [Terracidiphilus sp.]|jgi:hypothetical protein|nr:hypothetical protein [Terracidiphilus sp.]